MTREEYQGQKLSIYIGESDKFHGAPLHEFLLETAIECGLSGGTVIRGREGFGAHGEIHSAKILRLSDNLPLIVEFVGRVEKIDAFVEQIEAAVTEGLMTRSNVTIRKLRTD